MGRPADPWIYRSCSCRDPNRDSPWPPSAPGSDAVRLTGNPTRRPYVQSPPRVPQLGSQVRSRKYDDSEPGTTFGLAGSVELPGNCDRGKRPTRSISRPHSGSNSRLTFAYHSWLSQWPGALHGLHRSPERVTRGPYLRVVEPGRRLTNAPTAHRPPCGARALERRSGGFHAHAWCTSRLIGAAWI